MLKNITHTIKTTNTSLICVGLMFFLPFVSLYHQQPIPSFYAEWIAASLGFFALFELLKKASWSAVKIPQTSLILVGLMAILGMQWMLKMLHSTQYALLVLSYLVLMFFLMILGNYLRRELGWEKIASTLAWCLLIGGVVNVVVVAIQFAMRSQLSPDIIPDYLSYGAIAHANHFADYIALAIISLLYLFAKGKCSQKPFSITLVLFLITLSVSGSSISWLYLAAITILAIFMQANAMKQGTGSTAMRSLLRASLWLLPVFGLVQLILHYGLPNTLALPHHKQAAGFFSPSTMSAYMHVWYDSLHLFLQSPWLGIGAGATRYQSFLLIDMPTVYASKHIFENAHNLFLHVLSEMGIGGFLLLIVGLFAWLRCFKWRTIHLETWWLIALLAVLGIHSMLDYPLWFAYFSCIAAFLLGAGDEKSLELSLPKLVNISERFGHGFARGAIAVLMLLGAINLFTLLVANVNLEKLTTRVVDQRASQQELVQLDWIHRYSLLSPYAELIYTRSIALDPSHIEDKVWLSNSAMRFKPTRQIAYQHVLLQKLSGDEVGAVKQLNRTLIAHPGNFKNALGVMPMKYWQDYLDVLSIARPIKVKPKTSNK